MLSRVFASSYIFRLPFRSLSDVSYSDECRTKARDSGAIVGQGGRSFDKGTCTDNNVTLEFTFKCSGGFRGCGAWDRNYLRGKERVFFKLFSVEIAMHHD